MQKILIMTTNRGSMRDEVVGWSSEDGNCVMDTFFEYQRGERKRYPGGNYDRPNDIPVGLIGGLKYWASTYPSVLHAIGDGWKLMAPPIEYDETSSEGEKYKLFEWWLTKD